MVTILYTYVVMGDTQASTGQEATPLEDYAH